MMKIDASKNWYVVNTKPNSEPLAALNLERQNFEIFLPKITKTVRHARRVKSVQRPLFPGYLFVALEPYENPWRIINATIGVRHLLTTDGRPSAVLGDIMESLFSCTDNNGIISKPKEAFNIGDKVEILSGPLSQKFAEITSLPGKERVEILLGFFGGIVRSTVPIKHVTLAS